MPAEWRDDPTGVYAHRWWDGEGWTEHVALGGRQLTDDVTGLAELNRHRADATPADEAPGEGWFPDPSQRHTVRWWSGETWTAWAADGPGAVRDEAMGEWPAPSAAEETELPEGAPAPPESPGGGIGSQVRDLAVRATGGENRTVGDRVLHTVGTVTLANWVQGRVSAALCIPQLVEAVRQEPRNAIRRLHLGLRLMDAQEARSRMRKGRPYFGATQIVTRPMSRAVGKAVVNTLRSDTTPAHVKVLRPLHAQLVASLKERPRNAEVLNALARIYWSAGKYRQAMDVIEVSKKVDPSKAITYYIGAEVLLDMGYHELGAKWAEWAWSQGAQMAAAILHPWAPGRRGMYRSPKVSALSGYTLSHYLRSMHNYYEPVPTSDLHAYLGVLRLFDEGEQ